LLFPGAAVRGTPDQFEALRFDENRKGGEAVLAAHAAAAVLVARRGGFFGTDAEIMYMSAVIEINARNRSDAGKGASRRLRHEGLVPGIIYGGGKDPAKISVVHHELVHEMEREAFFSSILTLRVDGSEEPVVLKDMQRHPVKPFVMHVDFQRIMAGEKIHMTVPIHFLHEEGSAGVKKGGSVLHALTELDIVCLPKDLPASIDIDIANLDIGDVVVVSDLMLPSGVELDSDVDPGERVASIVKIEEKAEGEAEEEGLEAPGEALAKPDEEPED
jgi:large subunit ribosomal protein L25